MAQSLTHKLFGGTSQTLKQPKIKAPHEGYTQVQPSKIQSPYVTKRGKLIVPLHMTKAYTKRAK